MKKGKLGVSVAFLLVLVFFGAAVSRWDGLLERWCLYRLDAPEVDTRRTAIRELGERRSVRAIEPLAMMIGDFSDEELRVDILTALAKIGPRAYDTIVELFGQLSRERGQLDQWKHACAALQIAFETLASLGSETVPVLLYLLTLSYHAGDLKLARDAARVH